MTDNETTVRQEWGAKVTNPTFADYGRVFPMESAKRAKRWIESRNEHFAGRRAGSPKLVLVHRTITTTKWERA